MIKLIIDLPRHAIGLHAFGHVTEKEYKSALIPLISELLTHNKKINLLLVLETDITNFTPGAWCGNIHIGFKYFFKWNKVAIVTDQKGVLGYSDLFKYFVPGKFKTFPLDQLDKSIRWISQK